MHPEGFAGLLDFVEPGAAHVDFCVHLTIVLNVVPLLRLRTSLPGVLDEFCVSAVLMTVCLKNERELPSFSAV